MIHDLEHSPARFADSDDDPEQTSLSWPDPSPLQSWWDEVMGGGSPLAKPRTIRSSGQQAPSLRSA
ncbi:hypothetical protein [Nocardia sp. XZ_19_231]|uniref:hypothetical protein n=1 Tax=Nocardia sp. XZ_19_231 TaxID=2769252 RepID=UPI00188DCF8F|nr:hypothetical protein [Nocardia sp. XZ_19_231]